MKIIFKANDILEAHIVAGMLQSYGIATHVGGHYLQGAVGDLAPMGIANIFVQDDQVEEAELLVAEYQNDSASSNEWDDPLLLPDSR
ncbi:hypothetical protein VT06_04445 [Arsukibacterium sp. MJ3]|uniref:putative signal transducing protein n=1 Tax=Arsukibacterium sp. MJ3 TaxID=1632859 RepID=UPI000626EEB6|nr:DUF2007 domain-containing protein [Arsukibacterium sp. MJ3]KKO49849.1 hypothetical protein VT06_04445 [Arsukibacterium sp. MJ3]